MDFLFTLLPWWAWLVATALILGFAWAYLSKTGFAAVAAALLAAIAFQHGRRSANEQHKNRADRIERKREDAYSEIDRRGTTRDDAVERLRKGDY